MTRQRIAVIGSGVSGLVASYYLAKKHQVVLFEAENRLGGHTNTIEIGSDFGPDENIKVDTGFIVYNDQTYPNFIHFLDQLGLKGSPTEMSFSFSDLARNFAYSGTGLSGLLAQRGNAFNLGFWSFLFSIIRFNRRASKDLGNKVLEGISLANYLDLIKVPERLRRDYLGPMIQAIWSAAEAEAMAYPAASFVRFFNNHGLLSRPGTINWRYLKGGSHIYLQAFRKDFPGHIRLQEPVLNVERKAEGPMVRFQGGQEQFDSVIIAAHADQALAMLADADQLERSALSPWSYSKNRTVLHCDPAHMPPLKRAWACWNVVRQPEDENRRPVRVTYWMNRLQRLNAVNNWLVSLNSDKPFDPDSTVYETIYEHPVYSLNSIAAQKLLPSISGRRQTYFCGSYHGYGFHEDGARSAVDLVKKHFGLQP